MSWLKDVYQTGKAARDKNQALREATEAAHRAAYRKHDPMVRRLLQDVADMLWGPSGLFPTNTNLEITCTSRQEEEPTWNVFGANDTCFVKLMMSNGYDRIPEPHFFIEFGRSGYWERETTKGLTEEELKNALKAVLKPCMERGW